MRNYSQFSPPGLFLSWNVARNKSKSEIGSMKSILSRCIGALRPVRPHHTRRKPLPLCLVATAIILGLAVFLIGCQNSYTDVTGALGPGEKPRIAVVIPPYAWVMEQLAGSRAELVVLSPGAICAETFQPTDAEVSRLLRCHLLVRVGLPFEDAPWFRSIRHIPRIQVVDLTACLESAAAESECHESTTDQAAHPGTADSADAEHVLTNSIRLGTQADNRHHHNHDPAFGHDHCCDLHPHHGGAHTPATIDPHIWLVPRLVKHQATLIVDKLCQLDPQYRETYRANLESFVERMEKLDTLLRQKLAPVAGRRVLVFHPGWGHFAREYGLTEVAVEQGGKLPSDAELSQLQKELRAAGVRAMVVETDDPRHPGRTLANNLGLTVVTISPIAANIEETLVKFAEFAAQYAF